MAIQRLTREERRTRLLSAAESLFSEKGYRKTEVDEVARRAGVTKPVLYRHFSGGKSEIFVAVLDQHLEGLVRALWEGISGADQPKDRLRLGIRAAIRFAEKNPEGLRLLVGASGDLGSEAAHHVGRAREVIVQGIAKTIADVLRSYGIRTDGARIYAQALLGGVMQASQDWIESKEFDAEGLEDHIVGLFWSGFSGLAEEPALLPD